MTSGDYLKKIKEICLMYHAERVVLFGSRAKGLERPNSDFDIAVYGAADVQAIQDAIDDLPTLFSADVVDMDHCGNPGLISEVEDYGIPI